jgi:hypothetical protein
MFEDLRRSCIQESWALAAEAAGLASDCVGYAEESLGKGNAERARFWMDWSERIRRGANVLVRSLANDLAEIESRTP